MYLWGVGVEREDLELYRVELVNRYRSLRIRIQVFIKLLKDRVDLHRRLGIGEESRLFLATEAPLTRNMFPKLRTNLASSQDPADLPYDRFVTANIRRSVKHEADIVSQVVPAVVSTQFHGETDNSIVPGWTSHQPATKGALWYH